jgi:release factor glutamine methyltransferase
LVAELVRPQTINELRDALAVRLRSVSEQPLDDARELLASLHDAPRSWSSAHASDVALEILVETAYECAERRVAGQPMAYATKRAAFRHLFLHVDSRVLIPRMETEELVSLALPFISQGCTVVDVGTGSGAIALAIATEARAARVIGIDISSDAIAVAEMNARAVLQKSSSHTEFRCGHLLEPLGDERVEVVVSNPPYIALTESDELPALVRDWEPATALFGGATGMAIIAELAAQAAERLVSGGVIVLEIDSRRSREAAACFADDAWRDVRQVTDAFGRDRFVVARRAPRGVDGARLGHAAPEAAEAIGE